MTIDELVGRIGARITELTTEIEPLENALNALKDTTPGPTTRPS